MDEIRHQQGLLAQYRRNLKQLLIQAGQYGSVELAPQVTQNSINSTRENIARIKQILHNWRVAVDDNPDDFAPVAAPAKDVQVKISADKVMLVIPVADFAAMLQKNPELLQYIVYKS